MMMQVERDWCYIQHVFTPSRLCQTKQMGKKTEILDKRKDVEIAYLDFSEKNEYSITKEIINKAGNIEE